MNTDEKSPKTREYWICDRGHWYHSKLAAYDEQSESALTHVIDYSAYAKAVEALKALHTRVEQYASSGCIEAYSADNNGLSDVMDDVQQTLKQLGEGEA
jgi:DNA replication initiation complex subunit (GINS family)